MQFIGNSARRWTFACALLAACANALVAAQETAPGQSNLLVAVTAEDAAARRQVSRALLIDDRPLWDRKKEALTSLKKMAADPDAEVRANGIFLLARLVMRCAQSDPALVRPAIPELTTALDSVRADVQDGALGALALLGPAATNALPRIKSLLKAGQARVRYSAMNAWALIDNADPELPPTVLSLLQSGAKPDQIAAMRAVTYCLEPSKQIEEKIAEFLGSADPDLTEEAIAAIDHLKPLDRQFAPETCSALSKLLRDDNRPLAARVHSTSALGRMINNDPAIERELRELVQRAGIRDELLSAAIQALARSRQLDPETIRAVKQATADTTSETVTFALNEFLRSAGSR